MQDFSSMKGKIIRDQHAVAVEKYLFGAHDGSAIGRGQRRDALRRLLEPGREHVVGIVAEGIIAQRNVGGVVAQLLAAATQLFHPDILNVFFCQ